MLVGSLINCQRDVYRWKVTHEVVRSKNIIYCKNIHYDYNNIINTVTYNYEVVIIGGEGFYILITHKIFIAI